MNNNQNKNYPINLIGISGRIGSGKDTVGKIIQHLVFESKVKINLPFTNTLLNNSGFEIKKFADKLKDIVCMLIGCTREQLEDREFKEKELGEEWWYTYGKIGNVDMLVSYLDMDKEFKNSNNSYIEKLTPRLLLQLLGTECGRNILHPNIWVNSLFSDYKSHIENYPNLTKSDGKPLIEGNNYSMGKAIYPNWIITDMRFPNELEAVKSRGGISIRVNRPYSTVAGDNGIPATFNHAQFHPSETSLDSATFDFVISNDKDIEHLINEVRKILEKLNII